MRTHRTNNPAGGGRGRLVLVLTLAAMLACLATVDGCKRAKKREDATRDRPFGLRMVP